MSRLRIPAAAGAPFAVVVLALAAAGCNSSGGHPAATAAVGTARSSVPCTIGKAQRRAIARSLADIKRLQRIEEPLQTYSQHGAPDENTVTGKFLVDLGSAKLPVNVRSHLIHLAKAATRLCGDCSLGLEASEPFLNNREENRCG
jgi:hypothetical protein